MSQQKKQYEDALGSVFDFIFEESQKDPKKVKPVKVTGVDGTSEMVDAITAVLENPLLYVNETTKEALQDAIDIDMAKVGVGKRVPDVIKFNVQDIGKIISDPGAYIDKQFAKIEGIRKQQRAAWAGEEMKGVLGAMWARKSGLDKETQQAMLAAGRLGKVDEFSGRTIGLRTTMDTIDLPVRTEKLANKYLSSISRGLSKDEFKERFSSRLSPTQIDGKWNQYQKFRSDYQNLESAGKLEDLDKMHFDRNLFTFLESAELSGKALTEKRSGNKDKAREYTKAAGFLENVYSPEAARKYMEQQKVLLRNYSKAIEKLKSSSDPNKADKIKKIKADMRGISAEIRTGNLERLAGNLGQWEGMYYSAKDLFVDGNLLPNIINGKFFEDKYNSLNFLQPSKGEHFKRKGSIDIEMHIAKGGHNKFQNLYFEKMNNLYYLSPATWAKTLITGEGFAYLGHLAQKKFEKKITKAVADFDWEKFIKDLENGSDSYVKGLAGRISSENMKMIEKFIKKDSTLANLAHRFGAVSRLKQKIQDQFDKAIARKLRDSIGNALLTKIKNEIAVGLIKDWMVKGGMQTLVRGLTTAISAALGVVGTPLASVIAFVVSDLVYRISKPVLKFATQAIIYFLAGIAAFLFLITSMGLLLLGQHSHVAPNEVVECEASYGLSPIIDDPDNPGGLTPQGPMEPFVAGALDSGEQCLLGAGSYSCTQGPYGSFSHSKVAAMDIGGTDYFHAPAFCGNGGTCKITYVGDVHCAAGYAGGMVKFTAEYQGQTYEFKLIHVDTALTIGQTLTSGQRVARTMEWHETGSACSLGKHLHLETKLNGATVNPHDVMTKPTSQGGFGCGISPC